MMTAEIQDKTLWSGSRAYWVLSRYFQKPGCGVRRSRVFGYDCADDLSRLPVEETFRSLFFMVLTDQTISSVLPRFSEIVELFGFLRNTANSLHGTVSRRKSTSH